MSATFAEARAIVVKHDLRPSFALYRPPGLWPSFNAEEEQAQRVIADAAAELLTTSRRELDRLSHCHAWQWDAHRLLDEWLTSGRLVRAADQRLRAAEAAYFAIAQSADDEGD